MTFGGPVWIALLLTVPVLAVTSLATGLYAGGRKSLVRRNAWLLAVTAAGTAAAFAAVTWLVAAPR
jgi:hypothetical protein